MRIVYYVVGWPPDRFPNGVVSATASLAPALRYAGHEVQIFAQYGAPGGEATDVSPDVSFADPDGSFRKSIARRLRSRLSPNWDIFDAAPRRMAQRINKTPELNSADIVEMEESFGWSAVIAPRIAAPVVTRLHGPYFLTGAAGRDEPFTPAEKERVRREGAAIAGSAAVTAPSKFVLDAVRNHYALPLEEASVIPNAARTIDQARGWRLSDANPDEILFVGRFDRIKGADILLTAFAELAKTRPHLRLTFAGPTDRPLRIDGKDFTCEEFVRNNMPPEVARRIDFLGAVPLSSLGALRQRAFLTVICSRIEMFANVVLEALANGSPVVATKVGGVPETVTHGVDGFLTPPDAASLATAIAALLDNHEIAAQFAAKGRVRVERDYAPARVADMTIAKYRDVLVRAKKAPRARQAGVR